MSVLFLPVDSLRKFLFRFFTSIPAALHAWKDKIINSHLHRCELGQYVTYSMIILYEHTVCPTEWWQSTCIVNQNQEFSNFQLWRKYQTWQIWLVLDTETGIIGHQSQCPVPVKFVMFDIFVIVEGKWSCLRSPVKRTSILALRLYLGLFWQFKFCESFAKSIANFVYCEL